MFKTFVAGIILGAAAAGTVLYFVPLVDQVREYSIIGVMPNGGNAETFHANIPTDRIMTGAPRAATPLPTGLNWPADSMFANARVELFKIRNSKDAVVGVASRIAASNQDGDLIEWVLHLPARGSAYILMQPTLPESGDRVGSLRAGTQEFGSLTGQLNERWSADTTDAEDAPRGRLELRTSFVSTVEPEPQP